VGNWLSWHKLAWNQGGKTITAQDLLGRTVFYKVGHHGSHNATLKARGLELMPNGMTAFVPVDQVMAGKKGWHAMPLQALLDALRARGCTTVRIDEPLPSGAGLSEGPIVDTPSGKRSLYYQWSMGLD
jgi:hypothetical protein